MSVSAARSNQQTNQSVSTNQSPGNQPRSQPTKHPTNESSNQRINQPINQPNVFAFNLQGVNGRRFGAKKFRDQAVVAGRPGARDERKDTKPSQSSEIAPDPVMAVSAWFELVPNQLPV
jgi:hypothetical protein